MKRAVYIFIGLSFLTLLPIFTVSAKLDTGFVYDCANESTNGQTQPGDCTFGDLVNATKRVVDMATKYALFFSVIVLVYAGWRYMTSGGNPAAITKANNMFRSIAIGIFFVLAAWTIVHFIAATLLNTSITGSDSFIIKN